MLGDFKNEDSKRLFHFEVSFPQPQMEMKNVQFTSNTDYSIMKQIIEGNGVFMVKKYE